MDQEFLVGLGWGGGGDEEGWEGMRRGISKV